MSFPLPDNLNSELSCQLAVIGGGTGGFAAVWAALRRGLKVVVTEEYSRLGGQLTSQAVPPDEHPWIEKCGATSSYRRFRQEIREYYRHWYPLSHEAEQNWQTLNPGIGCVSAICHEPAVSSAVIEAVLRPYVSSGQLTVLTESVPCQADMNGRTLKSVEVKHACGRTFTIKAPYFIDATECGDLLPLSGTAYTLGSESKAQTGEPHAAEIADPHNVQAISHCFIIDWQADRNSVIEKPEQYDFWRSYIPQLTPSWQGPLLSWQAIHPITLEPVVRSFSPLNPKPERGPMDLWTFRRISCTKNFNVPAGTSDIVLVNWPQIDYLPGGIIDVSPEEKQKNLYGARQLSLSMLYWMQTEAGREDGGHGWPGLALRPDVTQTADGLAEAPYVRESRRIKGRFTVLEQHIGLEARCEACGVKPEAARAERFADSVGIGAYRIDLHPSVGGDNYIDVSALPFQIPLGALVPEDTDNLLAGGKDLSVTHITNGCYRLHPVEWNVGESAALCAAFCLENKVSPAQVCAGGELLNNFQNQLCSFGVELEWPDAEIHPL